MTRLGILYSYVIKEDLLMPNSCALVLCEDSEDLLRLLYVLYTLCEVQIIWVSGT